MRNEMLEGETVASGAEIKCGEANCANKGPQVLQSAAGYYIGYFCDKCGPYSRESGYYANESKAQEGLETGYSRL